MQHKTWWGWISHFFGHTLIGTAIFLIIAAPAVALSFMMRFFESLGVSHFTVQVLVCLEHVILVVDAVLFLTYLGATAGKVIKEMLS